MHNQWCRCVHSSLLNLPLAKFVLCCITDVRGSLILAQHRQSIVDRCSLFSSEAWLCRKMDGSAAFSSRCCGQSFACMFLKFPDCTMLQCLLRSAFSMYRKQSQSSSHKIRKVDWKCVTSVRAEWLTYKICCYLSTGSSRCWEGEAHWPVGVQRGEHQEGACCPPNHAVGARMVPLQP